MLQRSAITVGVGLYRRRKAPVDPPCRNAHRVTEPSIARAGCELRPSAGSWGADPVRCLSPGVGGDRVRAGVLIRGTRALRQHRREDRITVRGERAEDLVPGADRGTHDGSSTATAAGRWRGPGSQR
jgi:hypothetical protein